MDSHKLSKSAMQHLLMVAIRYLAQRSQDESGSCTMNTELDCMIFNFEA